MNTASLSITIDCAALPVQNEPVWDSYAQQWVTPPPETRQLSSAPRIGTGVSLVQGERRVRFSDVAQNRPAMSFDEESGLYRFTIEYQPLEADRFIGRPLSQASGFNELIVDFARVLAPYGLRYVGVSRVNLKVNGNTILELDDPSRLDPDSRRFALIHNEVADGETQASTSAY